MMTKFLRWLRQRTGLGVAVETRHFIPRLPAPALVSITLLRTHIVPGSTGPRVGELVCHGQYAGWDEAEAAVADYGVEVSGGETPKFYVTVTFEGFEPWRFDFVPDEFGLAFNPRLGSDLCLREWFIWSVADLAEQLPQVPPEEQPFRRKIKLAAQLLERAELPGMDGGRALRLKLLRETVPGVR